MQKVLIVDDEKSILELLSRGLKQGDFAILTATTIEEAESIIKDTQPELVIADIRLTGVLGHEGLELLGYVAEKSPGSRVIIMTGYGSPEIRAQAMELGAFEYFDKPLDLRELKACLQKAGLTFSKRKK